MNPEDIKELSLIEFVRECVKCSDQRDPIVDQIHLLCRNEEFYQAILPIAKKLGFSDSIRFYHDCYQFLRSPSKESWLELYRNNLKLEQVPGGAVERNINISSGTEKKLEELLGIDKSKEEKKYEDQADGMFDQIEFNDEFLKKFEAFFKLARVDIDKMFQKTEGIPYADIFKFGLDREDLNKSDKQILEKLQKKIDDYKLVKFGISPEALLNQYNKLIVSYIERENLAIKKGKSKEVFNKKEKVEYDKKKRDEQEKQKKQADQTSALAPALIPVGQVQETKKVTITDSTKAQRTGLIAHIYNIHSLCAMRLEILEKLTTAERDQFKKHYGNDYWDAFDQQLKAVKSENNQKKLVKNIQRLADRIAEFGIRPNDLPKRLRDEWRNSDFAILDSKENEKYSFPDMVNGLRLTSKYSNLKPTEKLLPLSLFLCAYYEKDPTGLHDGLLLQKRIVNHFRINPKKYIAELTTKLSNDALRLTLLIREAEKIVNDPAYIHNNPSAGDDGSINILNVRISNAKSLLKENYLVDAEIANSEDIKPDFSTIDDLADQIYDISDNIKHTIDYSMILPNLLLLGTKSYTATFINNLCNAYKNPDKIESLILKHQKYFVKRPEIVGLLVDRLFDAYKNDLSKQEAIFKKYNELFSDHHKVVKIIKKSYMNLMSAAAPSTKIPSFTAVAKVPPLVSSVAKPTLAATKASSVKVPVKPSTKISSDKNIPIVSVRAALPWKTKIFREFRFQSKHEFFGSQVVDKPALGKQIQSLLERSRHAPASVAEKLNLLSIKNDIVQTKKVFISYQHELTNRIQSGSSHSDRYKTRLGLVDKYINQLTEIQDNIAKLEKPTVKFNAYGSTVSWVHPSNILDKVNELRQPSQMQRSHLTISHQAPADLLKETIALPLTARNPGLVGIISNAISPSLTLHTAFENKCNRIYIDEHPSSHPTGNQLFKAAGPSIGGVDKTILTAAIICIDDARNRFGNNLLIRGASELQMKAMKLYCAFLAKQGQDVALRKTVGGPNLVDSPELSKLLPTFEKIYHEIKPETTILQSKDLKVLKAAERLTGKLSLKLDKAALKPPRPGGKKGGGFHQEP